MRSSSNAQWSKPNCRSRTLARSGAGEWFATRHLEYRSQGTVHAKRDPASAALPFSRWLLTRQDNPLCYRPPLRPREGQPRQSQCRAEVRREDHRRENPRRNGLILNHYVPGKRQTTPNSRALEDGQIKTNSAVFLTNFSALVGRYSDRVVTRDLAWHDPLRRRPCHTPRPNAVSGDNWVKFVRAGAEGRVWLAIVREIHESGQTSAARLDQS